MKSNISNIIGDLGITTQDILLISVGLWFVMIILVVVLFIKNYKLKKRYTQFMVGDDGKSLENSICEKMKQFDIAKAEFDTVHSKIKDMSKDLSYTFQKVGLKKYDAFDENGGKLSFALALLSPKNDGILINSVHSREGSYLYLKEIVNGQSTSSTLANEEKDAVEQAIKNV